MLYRRLSDNQMVPASEACDASGAVRDGYAMSVPYGSRMAADGEYISFSMAFMDSAPAGQPSSLSPERRLAIVARAEMQHRTRYGYLGDKAPAFTQQLADAAVRRVESDTAQTTASKGDWTHAAAAERAANAAARNQMIDGLRNAWRQ